MAQILDLAGNQERDQSPLAGQIAQGARRDSLLSVEGHISQYVCRRWPGGPPALKHHGQGRGATVAR